MTATDVPDERMIEEAPIGIFQVTVDREHLEDVPRDEEHIYVNTTLADILGFDSREAFYSSASSVDYADPADREALLELVEESGQVDAFETGLVTQDGDPVPVLISGSLEEGQFTGYVTDITERKRLERKAEQQAEAILEQSMPIVQLWEGVTLATVVGTLDTDRAQQLTENLLAELTETRSTVALVDITGVPSVDTATAQHLIDTVNAVSLLGSEVIITGINPEIAQTLVQIGSTMEGIRTMSSLAEGLAYGLERIGEDVALTEPR